MKDPVIIAWRDILQAQFGLKQPDKTSVDPEAEFIKGEGFGISPTFKKDDLPRDPKVLFPPRTIWEKFFQEEEITKLGEYDVTVTEAQDPNFMLVRDIEMQWRMVHWCTQKYNVKECSNLQAAGEMLRRSSQRAVAANKPEDLGPISHEMDALGQRVGFGMVAMGQRVGQIILAWIHLVDGGDVVLVGTSSHYLYHDQHSRFSPASIRE